MIRKLTVKNDRIGEQLWSEWDGELYESKNSDSLVYYTEEHVDLENDVVKRGLASSLQRDGVVDSLGQGFKEIESCEVVYGWAGYLEDEMTMLVCDEFGETYYGDILDNIIEITFVEF